MDLEKKPGKISARNWIVIASVLALAAALLIVSRFMGPGNSLSGDEIQAMMSALPTVSPAPSGSSTAEPEAAAQATETAQEPEGYLFVLLDNKVYAIEPLGEEKDLTIDQGGGIVNVVHLLPDGFYMASSTCDNQLCVLEGAVTLDNYQGRFLGTSVYCLPHHIQLELVVVNATPSPDMPDI